MSLVQISSKSAVCVPSVQVFGVTGKTILAGSLDCRLVFKILLPQKQYISWERAFVYLI